MTIPINVAAAKHLDNLAKEKSRETAKQKQEIIKQQVKKCNCSYQSPFKDCPQCGDVRQWGIEE